MLCHHASVSHQLHRSLPYDSKTTGRRLQGTKLPRLRPKRCVHTAYSGA